MKINHRNYRYSQINKLYINLHIYTRIWYMNEPICLFANLIDFSLQFVFIILANIKDYLFLLKIELN